MRVPDIAEARMENVSTGGIGEFPKSVRLLALLGIGGSESAAPWRDFRFNGSEWLGGLAPQWIQEPKG